MRRRSPARWAVPPLIAVLVTLGAAAPAAAAPADEQAPVQRYVALGDSYAAGPLVPLPTGQPAGCLRSTTDG